MRERNMPCRFSSLSLRLLAVVALVMLPRAAAFAQSSANVLVVVNEISSASVRIGEYYRARRSIPDSQILRIKTAEEDQVSRDTYLAEIETPIAAWLGRNSAQDRVLYIVLTKGVPLTISGTAGRNGTITSVDSELTLLYRKLTRAPVSTIGRITNPYYSDETAGQLAVPFSHEKFDTYLVTRLDGFTVEDVVALIDRGAAPSREGTIVLDQTLAMSNPANGWLAKAAERLKSAGWADRVLLERTARRAATDDPVLAYASWGSNDPAAIGRQTGLRFVKGALAVRFLSSDARTFTEPPPAWQPGRAGQRASYFAGTPQSLTADLIREGITGAAGYVAEPLLDGSIRPDVLIPAYLSGLNLAEAFYRAMPVLSWQTVVVGDPLCAAFRQTSVSDDVIDKGVDPETELPAYFSERRLARMSRRSSLETRKLAVLGEARLAKGDRDGARAAFEQAINRDERLVDAQVALATIYDATGNYDHAIASYQAALTVDPKNVVALNNLAYMLAVRRKAPADAIGFAQMAWTLAGRSGEVSDTLGWIHHLLGDDRQALALLTHATKAAPRNPEIRVHTAAVYAALDRVEDAERELKAALTLDPQLAGREDVKELVASLTRK